MNPLLKSGFAILTIVLGAACSGNGESFSPTAPSATPGPPPTPGPPQVSPGASPGAVSISLGETVVGVVSEIDPQRDTRWGPEPCVRFSVATPTSGVLRVRLTSTGPNGLTLWLGSSAFWGKANEITAEGRVQAGETYEIAVSLHESGHVPQQFELTASLDPLEARS